MTEQDSRTLTRADWIVVGVLLMLVLPLRCWLLYNTEVTARDSIGYIRYALQFERMPWYEVWEKNHQHPGYPICVWLMSQPVRALTGEPTPENMELTTQLVNFFASLILILPMYVLGRQFFDRTICFTATLLYQYLPVSAHHLSDGISEPLYLVLLVTALLHMVWAIRDHRLANCVGCGLFTGLAYLFRPEGLLVMPAFALTLVMIQFRPEWRTTRSRFLACGVSMALTAMLVGSVYVYATGRITNKLSAIETLKNLQKIFVPPMEGNAAAADDGALLAASFVASDVKAIRVWQSVSAYGKEILQGLHYVTSLSAILGFLGSFSALRRQPGFLALWIYAGLHSFILIALAMSVHYVSDRHVMILVLSGCFFVVVGLREFPRWILWGLKIPDASAPPPVLDAAAPSEGNAGTPAPPRGLPWYQSSLLWFAVLYIGLLGLCLPRATQRLHGMRVGNHQAGLWLAAHVQPDDVIEDDHSWSSFFSGLIFLEGKEPVRPRDNQSKCYVVTTRSRDPIIDAQRMTAHLTKDATVVFTWPENVDPSQARVIVHAQPRDFKTHPWRVAPSGESDAGGRSTALGK